jgi:hypothetical protein
MLHHPGETWTPIHPGVWVAERSYNTRVLSEMLDAFEAERVRSLHWLDGLKHPNWEQESPAPWGSMKAGEMFAAWVAHDTLHFRQIVELRYGRVLRPGGALWRPVRRGVVNLFQGGQLFIKCHISRLIYDAAFCAVWQVNQHGLLWYNLLA